MYPRRYGPGRDGLIERFSSAFETICPKDLASYTASKQMERVYPGFIRYTYWPIHLIWWIGLIPLTLICTIYLSFKKQSNFSIKYKYIIFFLLFGHILNTLVCGTFSNYENSRYVTRTLWFVNLAMILIWVQMFQYMFLNKLQNKA